MSEEEKKFLEIVDLKKGFGSGQTRQEVLRGMNFSVAKGEFCVLLGPSGSGKSTLLNIIGGIDNADSGYININGDKLEDTKSSFADWLNNQNVRNQLKLDIKICLVKNGYPPQYSPEVFNKVMEQVENFEEYSITEDIGNEVDNSAKIYQYEPEYRVMKVAEDSAKYGKD